MTSPTGAAMALAAQAAHAAQAAGQAGGTFLQAAMRHPAVQSAAAQLAAAGNNDLHIGNYAAGTFFRRAYPEVQAMRVGWRQWEVYVATHETVGPALNGGDPELYPLWRRVGVATTRHKARQLGYAAVRQRPAAP